MKCLENVLEDHLWLDAHLGCKHRVLQWSQRQGSVFALEEGQATVRDWLGVLGADSSLHLNDPMEAPITAFQSKEMHCAVVHYAVAVTR